MEIADRRVASFHYTLTDDAGKVLESSRGGQPLTYIHGIGSIVPGLEKALEGKQAGDRFSVDVPPEQAYGPRHDVLVQTLPRSVFVGQQAPAPGVHLQAKTERGPMRVVVTGLDDDRISVDGNHPLAGKTLHFEVEVTAVRVANPQELQFGQPG